MEIRVDHPLIASEIAKIRQITTLNDFRNSVKKISTLLAFPVLEKLETEEFVSISVLNEKFFGKKITTQVVFTPILRAGFGMLEPFLELVSDAKIAPLWLKRNLDFSVQTYFQNLQNPDADSVAIILDPILATGNSLSAAIEILVQKGFQKIMIATILTVQEGIDKIRQQYPNVTIFYCQKDEKLNKKGYIIPGIGDAGDRFFGA
ncbi:uracil phosphoribosyltransferase [Mycoplasma flocculare]|uniref:Uracil phosphoribosyltransferase n=2 Tax=Mesomycoplasma flocculare TaxID=2128 RepID=A0A0A8E6T7_MESFC|nr:uracil phosphoribosyltransferase [Mesomycoplasma flocculare]MXR39339.1 uracil phosphoribosyltransferase [Mycoplasma sp. MF12]AJC49713.1 uracil phosphoribosyltransferase [Mesomycoplasma flocculare ATCC 27399]ENX51105.1 uracil phosphoribosyltransferase [Mesomycoplasma flocculare ATCC 27716]MXR05753.1 uracil phosphoribosyltransferase [Mesomycoplasma flocculare]MXR12125.1 uracil phosphoribosyltransferase [Mesomycoplasma flocculare]